MRIIVIFILMLLLGTMPTPSLLAQDTLIPEEVIGKLVTAPHGLTWESGPEIADLLAQVQQNPASYIPYLIEKLTIDRFDTTDLRQAEIAAMALVEAGGNTGRTELRSRLNELYNYSDQLQAQLNEHLNGTNVEAALPSAVAAEVIELRLRLDLLGRIERTIVNSYANAQDPRLKNLILERLKGEGDVSNQLTYILYFQQNSNSIDNEVRKQIEVLLNDTHSEFYNSSLLRKVIGSPKDRINQE